MGIAEDILFSENIDEVFPAIAKRTDKPNHPRQKYLHTAKGATVYNEIKKNQ